MELLLQTRFRTEKKCNQYQGRYSSIYSFHYVAEQDKYFTKILISYVSFTTKIPPY